jgi:DNA-binding transcriptional ArsR family regulator
LDSSYRLDKISINRLNNNMSDSRQAKEAVFEAIAAMTKALASPRRLELIDLLAQRPRTVEELARATEQSSANTSQHLQALHGAGIVERERDGLRVRYSLAGDDILEAWSMLQTVSAERIAEVERAARGYLGEPVEGIDRADLEALRQTGDIIIVDVRPEDEYRAGHVQGALSIPIDQLGERLAELPEGSEVVAYCRGPFCAYAHEAVRQLRDAGRAARRLEGGWPEWKLAQGAR